MKYKVLSDAFDVTNEGEEPTHYVKDDVVELDDVRAQAAIDAGWIMPAEVTEDMLKENPELANAGVEVGSPITIATEEEIKAAGLSEVKVESAEVAEEPRKRYRGQLVNVETERTVGTQTFKHIQMADGSEYDLTNQEYENEVKLSYSK